MRTATASLVFLDATEMGRLNSGVALPITINGTPLLLQKEVISSTRATQSKRMKEYWAKKRAEKKPTRG